MRTVKTLWLEIFSHSPWLLPLALLSCSVYALQTLAIWFQTAYFYAVQQLLIHERTWQQVLMALLLFYAVRSIVGGFIIPFGAAKDLYYESQVTETALTSQIRLSDKLSLENYNVSRVFQLLFRAQQALTSGSLRQIFNNVAAILALVLSLGALIGSFMIYSPWFAVLALLTTLPLFTEQFIFTPRIRVLRTQMREQRRLLEQQRRHVLDPEFFLETQQAEAGEYFARRFTDISLQIQDEERDLTLKQARFAILGGLVRVAGNAGMLLLAFSLAHQGLLDTAAISALFSLQLALQSSVAFLASQLSGLAFQWHEIKEMCDIYALQHEPRGSVIAAPIGAIHLTGICYRYPNAERDALRDINLTITPGEKIALLGVNGAGKSTLAHIVLGLLQPTAGTLRYGEQDLAEIDLTTLQKRMSAVFQEFGVYQLSVEENIALSCYDTTDCTNTEKMDITRTNDHDIHHGEIMQALQRAGFPLHKLPDGAASQLGQAFGGSELSRGEGQRLCLARAYRRQHAEFLLVDEPTAALDPLAEEQLYAEILAAASGRTTLILSHRLASAQLADRIIILEDGVIAEQGDHATLLQQGGHYAKMYREQAALYRR